MGKSSGSIRASKWDRDIYNEGGLRREYEELSAGRKAAVRAESKAIAKAMYRNLADKSVTLTADSQEIKVQFTKSGIDHVARDAMIILSGKYMSKKSMIGIDQILAKSEYVHTDHQIYKTRKDGKELFFRYKDKDGRGIYFKVAYDRKQNRSGRYYLYSVVDR